MTYGAELGCMNNCIDVAQDVSYLFSGVAIMLYSIIPAELNNKSNDITGRFFYPLVVVVKVAALYKTVATGVDATGVCSTATVTITSLFLCVCIIGGGMLVGISDRYSDKEMDDKPKPKPKPKPKIVFSLFLLAILTIIPFLLADNIVPLRCGFTESGDDTVSDTVLSNFNLTECTLFIECINAVNVRHDSATRLVLFFICIVGFGQIILHKRNSSQ